MDSNNSQKIMNDLERYIREKLDQEQADTLIIFARQYFSSVLFDDLEMIEVADLYGAALSHWNMALQLKKGQHKVKVYNPSLDVHGWQSRHTIVEIVIEDMPFLLQSISMEINRLGLTNHLVIHPVFHFLRGEQSEIQALTDEDDEQGTAECFLHLEIDRQAEQIQMDRLEKSLANVLTDVRAATADWQLCLASMKTVKDELSQSALEYSEDLDEILAFLQWLCDDHFVFLGYRQYQLIQQDDKNSFKPLPGTGLGILRDEIASLSDKGVQTIANEGFDRINNANPLLITKATSKATVHRSVFMDYIGIKQYDSNGMICGEKRFLGLYSSAAYLTELKTVPLVRAKINYVIERFAFRKSSHRSRALAFVLQSLPRDEIFQTNREGLFEFVFGIMQLQERQRVRVFARHDVYGHFVSLLVFVPRERYYTETRKKIQDILLEAFSAKFVDFSVQLSESILARIHFIIHTDSPCCKGQDVTAIEQKIIEALANWQDDLHSHLLKYCGEARANDLMSHYQDSFTAAYREDVSSRTAMLDIERFEHLLNHGQLAESLLYSPLTTSRHKTLRFKLFSIGQASLSASLPMLENMGVKVSDERPYEISKKGYEQELWLHDFGLSIDIDDSNLNLENLKPRFQDAFDQCWFGRTENDGFNQLVIRAGVNWQQVNIFRAFYLYLRQVGITFSQSYVETTLANNPEVVRLLVHFFNQRFDPSLQQTENSSTELATAIEQAIDQVKSLDEDRILRRYLNLLQAAVRTNFFKEPLDDQGIPYLAVKFRSEMVIDMPSPIPYFEIFVYSPRIEGIHLRGGPTARGGLRWSDRREDFRTEILGLMKAQMTKNSVIVPTGAKGGFIVKRLNKITLPEQRQQEVINCYRILIKGLLDLTDNLLEGKVIKPAELNCYDEDDTYLVVAADKGTAKFSDYANELSQQYQFWLNDAFASGGSFGYDHKMMGITARGAWESVKHHFCRLNIDYQSKPFSVVGIGGMAGDVFGNGMLLSDQIRLIAAFDHENILLDPDPDPQLSLQERQRLFALPGASWSDYNSKVISKGGGIFSRQAKSIQLSPQVKFRLNTNADRFTPNELIKCLLCAPVDLLWNGGIGTYVKGQAETILDVGDRANDAVRVNGKDLRCRVVAEGGNLGFTQAGRIEFAASGGLINTDSIDNSAGVDCSDHEVNIKILLNSLMSQGDLTAKQRNELLGSMTDAVAALVLKNNAAQNLAITMIEHASVSDLQSMQCIVELLVNKGNLNRSLEYIPTHDEFIERVNAEKGLHRPEICVILAYSKQMLKQQLLPEITQMPDTLIGYELNAYFPEVLQQKYTTQIRQHYLAYEIVANELINAFVNRMGIVFPYRIMDETGHPIQQCVAVYRVVCQVFSIDPLWTEINQLSLQLSNEVTVDLYGRLRKLIERSMHWFLIHDTLPGNEAEVTDFINGIQQLKIMLPDVMSERFNKQIDEQVDHYCKQGVPNPVAFSTVIMDMMYLGLDIIWLDKNSDPTLEDCARVFFHLIETMDLLWLRGQISQLPKETVWQSLARRTAREEFNAAIFDLALAALRQPGNDVADQMDAWFSAHQQVIESYQQLLGMVKSDSSIELEKVTVLLKKLIDIAGCPH
jgi:glutamate dehydrogenase